MGSPTEFLTLNTLEYPSGAVASSLSDILETGDVPQRYFLSATACRGILRRAEKRGKELPVALKSALLAVASQKPAHPRRTMQRRIHPNQLGVGAVELPEVVGTLSDGAHMGGGLTGRTPTPEESSLAHCVAAHM
jgi:hypothetical protein